MQICALVLNWRKPEATIRCVSSLMRDAPDVDVLIVDNASADGSVAKLRDAFPGIPLLENPSNLGYAGGNNAGFSAVLERRKDAAIGQMPREPDAFLVLNNDVVLRPGCVDALRSAAGDGRGLLAPVSFSSHSPHLIDMHVTALDLRYLAVTAPGRGEAAEPTEDTEIDYAPGSAFLIRTDLVRELGGFDERFFLVWEDVDLALRARRAGHGKPLSVAAAQVEHEGSISFGGSDSPLYRYFFVRNSFLVARNHLSGIRRFRALRMLDRRYRGWIDATQDSVLARAIQLGLEDGLTGRFGPPNPELT